MATKTPWAVIIIGSAAFVLIVVVGLAGVAGYVIYQQFAFKATTADERKAEEEFTSVIAQFEGQKPYLVIRDGEPEVSDAIARAPGKPVETLHILVWNPDDRKVIRLNMPFWLLRMTSGHPIRLSGTEDSYGERLRLNITAEDLERRGPGLILDHREASGERVLVWAQ